MEHAVSGDLYPRAKKDGRWVRRSLASLAQIARYTGVQKVVILARPFGPDGYGDEMVQRVHSRELAPGFAGEAVDTPKGEFIP